MSDNETDALIELPSTLAEGASNDDPGVVEGLQRLAALRSAEPDIPELGPIK